MANGIDLGQIYGLNTCPPGGCGPTGVINPNIPSLEQIASFNLATATPQPSRYTESPNLFQSNTQTSTGQGQAIRENPPQSSVITSDGAAQARSNAAQGMQSAANGVTSSENVPMTQAQINAENPAMLAPITEYSQPFPVTADSIQYLNSFLRTQIGRRVKVEFQIGNGNLVTRQGFLLAVGANFILINEDGTDDILSCDFYAIKFVTFYY